MGRPLARPRSAPSARSRSASACPPSPERIVHRYNSGDMSDLSVGSTFAGCRLEAVAGRGGMGVVYRAMQLTLNRRVAVKAIAPSLAQDVSFRERFQSEAKLTASIDHPNVIPVYEAGDAHGTLYLIM